MVFTNENKIETCFSSIIEGTAYTNYLEINKNIMFTDENSFNLYGKK